MQQVEVETIYVAPGNPWENGYAESFHGRLRDEFLACEVFENHKRVERFWRREGLKVPQRHPRF